MFGGRGTVRFGAESCVWVSQGIVEFSMVRRASSGIVTCGMVRRRTARHGRAGEAWCCKFRHGLEKSGWERRGKKVTTNEILRSEQND